MCLFQQIERFLVSFKGLLSLKLPSIAKTTVAPSQLRGIHDLCFMFILKLMPEKFKGRVQYDDFA